MVFIAATTTIHAGDVRLHRGQLVRIQCGEGQDALQLGVTCLIIKPQCHMGPDRSDATTPPLVLFLISLP